MTGRNAIQVDNQGVGPAKVVTFEVFYDGQPAGDPYALLDKCCGLSSHPDMTFLTTHPITVGEVADNVIRPSESRTMLSFRASDAAPGAAERSAANLGRITFRSCYCSILDRCWRTSLRGLDQSPVRSCPAPAQPSTLRVP